jgi:hypothetical protein
VVWLTYREAGPSAGTYRSANAVLRMKAAADPVLVLADWAGRSASLPTSWFSADGIHLGPDAAREMADLIADTLDLLPLPPDPNACQITDSQITDTQVTDTQITDTTAVVAPAVAAPSGADIRGAAQADQGAVRLNLRCPA